MYSLSVIFFSIEHVLGINHVVTFTILYLFISENIPFYRYITICQLGLQTDRYLNFPNVSFLFIDLSVDLL